MNGPLITQADRTIDILYTKYFKALISYEKLQRMETYMLSMGVIRELLLNPVNHKDYARGVPIQISVFEDHIEIFNVGSWPSGIPLDDTLYQRHESIPYNPKIADVFYRAGEIEAWGSGFLKIRLECEKINAPLPIIKRNDSGIAVGASACDKYMQVLNMNKSNDRGSHLEDINIDWLLQNDNEGKELVLIERSKQKKDRRDAYEYMVEVCSEKLTEREKKKIYPIVEYFKTHDQIDRVTAEKICGKGSTTTIGYLNKLISLGVIKKQKESVATVYRIVGS